MLPSPVNTLCTVLAPSLSCSGLFMSPEEFAPTALGQWVGYEAVFSFLALGREPCSVSVTIGKSYMCTRFQWAAKGG